MKKVIAVLEKGKDGFGVSFDNVPNVYAFGETLADAKQEAADALTFFVNSSKELKKPIPEILQGKYEIVFEFETTTLFKYVGSVVNRTALAKVTKMTASQISQYATGRKKPRPAQRQKIVDGLHKIGQELLIVS